MEPQNKSNNKIGTIIGVVVIVVVAVVALLSGKKTPDVTPTPDQAAPTTSQAPEQNLPATTPATPQSSPADTAKKSVSIYKDGTYSATGSYMSPGGPDQIAITLTIANDIVTDVSATPEPGDGTSARYQNKFVSGYKQYVVGKNIADINLSAVSGSSLTPQGFNDALAQIKTQAKA